MINKTIQTTKVKDPIVKPSKPVIDNDLLISLKDQTNTEQQVIVHCEIQPEQFFSSIRIWRSTFLRDLHSSHQSHLLNAYNISFYPQWTFVAGLGKVSFTLIFESLPKECNAFNMFEDIPTGNGFYTATINRNVNDVYQVEILY